MRIPVAPAASKSSTHSGCLHILAWSSGVWPLEFLLENCVDANLPTADEIGSTPAIIASSSGHVKLLALLLDRGADPNLARRDGYTAAHAACQFGHLKCLQLLRERNANLSSKNSQGCTPLDLARGCKQPECVDLLLAAGATGMRKEDLPPMSDADTVRVAAARSVCL